MIRLCLFLAAGLLAQAASAQAVYKCGAAGAISYSDRPCADGRGTRLPPPAAGVALPEANTAAARDARTLLELEKLRLARERDAARAEREQQKLARTASARRKGCDKLRLRHKWAQEDVARAHGNALDAARLKAKRQGEALAVECPV
jgi:hypothetical protein